MSAPPSHFAIEQLSGLTTVTGSLRELGTLDLLQAIHDSKRSASLSIRSAEHHAAVFFRNGDIIEAELGPLRGERALYGALSWSEGSFAVDFREPEREDAMRTSTRRVLWEGRNWLEERVRRIAKLPDLRAVFAVERRRLLEKLAELPDEMNLVLRLFDAKRSLREILAQSELDELSALSAFSRLIGEGVLVDTAPAQRAVAPGLAQPRAAHGSLQSAMPLGLRKTLDYYEPQVPVLLDPPPRPSPAPSRSSTDRTLRGMQAPLSADSMPVAIVKLPTSTDAADSGTTAAPGERASVRLEPPRRVRARRRRSSGESTIPTRRARTFASSPEYLVASDSENAAPSQPTRSAAATAVESAPASSPDAPVRPTPAWVRAIVAIGIVALIAGAMTLLARL